VPTSHCHLGDGRAGAFSRLLHGRVLHSWVLGRTFPPATPGRHDSACLPPGRDGTMDLGRRKSRAIREQEGGHGPCGDWLYASRPTRGLNRIVANIVLIQAGKEGRKKLHLAHSHTPSPAYMARTTPCGFCCVDGMLDDTLNRWARRAFLAWDLWRLLPTRPPARHGGTRTGAAHAAHCPGIYRCHLPGVPPYSIPGTRKTRRTAAASLPPSLTLRLSRRQPADSDALHKPFPRAFSIPSTRRPPDLSGVRHR